MKFHIDEVWELVKVGYEEKTISLSYQTHDPYESTKSSRGLAKDGWVLAKREITRLGEKG